MKYYNDEIERILLSVFDSKLKYSNSLKVVSQKTGIDVEDIADSLLEMSLSYIKSNELNFEKNKKTYPHSPEKFFVGFIEAMFWHELHNLKNYVNNCHSELTGRTFYNTDKAEWILKPARRNTIIKQLI